MELGLAGVDSPPTDPKKVGEGDREVEVRCVSVAATFASLTTDLFRWFPLRLLAGITA